MSAPTLWTPQRRKVILPQPTVPLTLSGNEITPYVRRFNREGDGLNPNEPLGKYSIGVHEATTNFIPNSSFATGTTGWSPAGTNTIERVSVASEGIPAPFPGVTHVGKLTFGSSQYGVQAALTVLSATLHTASVYLYVPSSTSAGPFAIWCDGFTGGSGAASVINMSARDRWQWPTTQRTPDAGDLTGTLLLYANTGVYTVGDVIYIFGAQVENQPLATPLVHTDGGTASRSAAAPRIPASIIKRFINENTSWVAMRWKMPWASALVPTTDPRAFWWGVNDDRITMDFGATGISLLSDTTTNRVATQAGTFVANEEITVIGAWVPATVYASLNGAAPNTAARNSEIPDIGEAFDIGYRSDTGVSHADATLLFMAMGKGTLSIANYAAIHNIARYNRIDSRPEDLPGGCTFKWPPADGDVTRALVTA